MFIRITLETTPNEMQCDETNSHMVTAGWSYFRLQQADHMPILFRVTAGRSYVDLISGYSRPILFQHSAKRMHDGRQNHHGWRQNELRLLWNALLTTPYVK